jgi:F420-dependent oxidoreductase-like protein
MIEGQEDVTWDDWLALGTACEQAGLEALFTSDHYYSVFDRPERGSCDAWAVLAGLAARTSKLRLGTLVSPVTFRHPAVLAKTAATVDRISGGRVEVGLGAGWWEEEHRRYGFPFPPLGERMRMLEEQTEIVHRLLGGEEVTFAGGHYALEECPGRHRPARRPPLVLAGEAGPRSARLAARFADEYNTHGVTIDTVGEVRARLEAAWEEEGRDRASLVLSVMMRCVVGADRTEVRERVRRMAAVTGEAGDPDEILAANARRWVAGTTDEAIVRLREYEAAGVDRFMLQHFDHRDVEMVRLIGREVAPAVR